MALTSHNARFAGINSQTGLYLRLLVVSIWASMGKEIENCCKYTQATDVGCVRELNEDSVFSKLGLWIVADGMGGHACGEVASAMAVQEIVDCFERGDSLSDAIQSAHMKIIEAGTKNDAQSGMGTTVVAMNAFDGKYQIAWVGDSRAYLWDEKKANLTQVSQDHSLMVRLVHAGLISEQDALTHPQRHMITQCLGSTEIDQVKVDTLESDWRAGQQILLCSDGLTDEVPEKMIQQIMASNISITEKSALLVRAAKQSGGRDNITLIIIDSPLQKQLSLMNKIKNLFGL